MTGFRLWKEQKMFKILDSGIIVESGCRLPEQIFSGELRDVCM